MRVAEPAVSSSPIARRRCGRSAAAESRGTERGVNVFHVRVGRVTRIVAYYDRENSLADLGLPAVPRLADPD
jgi:hypothetical protein